MTTKLELHSNTMQKSQEKTMKNRTFREQSYVENLIQSFFDRYFLKCLQNEKLEDQNNTEEEEEEDLEKAISHFLLKYTHGQYLLQNLKSTGTIILLIFSYFRPCRKSI